MGVEVPLPVIDTPHCEIALETQLQEQIVSWTKPSQERARQQSRPRKQSAPATLPSQVYVVDSYRQNTIPPGVRDARYGDGRLRLFALRCRVAAPENKQCRHTVSPLRQAVGTMSQARSALGVAGPCLEEDFPGAAKYPRV